MSPEQDLLPSFLFVSFTLLVGHSHHIPSLRLQGLRHTGLSTITQTVVPAYEPDRIVCSERRVHLLPEWWDFTHPRSFRSDNTQHRRRCLPLRQAEGSGSLSSQFQEQHDKRACLPRGQGLCLTNLYTASTSKATWNRTGNPKKLLVQRQNKQTSGCSNDQLTALNTSQGLNMATASGLNGCTPSLQTGGARATRSKNTKEADAPWLC